MKRLFICYGAIIAVLVVSGLVMGAAPTNNSTYNVTTTKAVTAQHDATTWTVIDSSIILETDTCDVYWQVTGTVTLQPDQKLFVAFRDSPDGTRANEKTYQLPDGAEGPMTITWGNFYVDSLRSQTDKTDSIFIDCAVLGTGMGESVTVTNVYYTGTVIDYDAP